MLDFLDKLSLDFRDNNQHIIKPAAIAFFVAAGANAFAFILKTYCYNGARQPLAYLMAIPGFLIYGLALGLPYSSIKGKHYADAIVFIVVFILVLKYA